MFLYPKGYRGPIKIHSIYDTIADFERNRKYCQQRTAVLDDIPLHIVGVARHPDVLDFARLWATTGFTYFGMILIMFHGICITF